MKRRIAFPVGISLIGLSIFSIYKYEEFKKEDYNKARIQFEENYEYPSINLKNIKEEIKAIEYTEKQKIDYATYLAFTNIYKVSNFNCDHEHSFCYKNYNKKSFDNAIKSTELRFKNALPFLRLDEIIDTSEKSINRFIPEHQVYTETLNIFYMRIVSLIEENKNNEAEYLFDIMHSANYNHFVNSNTIDFKKASIDRLLMDLEFVKFIEKKYNLDLDVKILKESDFSMKKAIYSRLEARFNQSEELAAKGYGSNFLNEYTIKHWIQIMEYFELERKDMINYNYIEYKPNELEYKASSILSNLADIKRPHLIELKNKMYSYNDYAKNQYKKDLS